MNVSIRVDAAQAQAIAAAMQPSRLEGVLVKALRKAMGPVVSAVRAAAPVGRSSLSKGHLAGQLKRSIHLSVNQRRGLRVSIVAAPHAHLVEGGHQQVVGGRATRAGRSYTNKGGVLFGKKGGRYTGSVVGQVQAHPFIKPTIDPMIDEVGKVISDEVVRSLELASRIAKVTGRAL